MRQPFSTSWKKSLYFKYKGVHRGTQKSYHFVVLPAHVAKNENYLSADNLGCHNLNAETYQDEILPLVPIQ